MPRPEALRTHFIGILLILLSLSTLAGMTLLPNYSDKGYTLPFLPDSSGSSVHLVFAGFPGCGTVCPLAMNELRQVALHFEGLKNTTGPDFSFVNIELDTPDAVSEKYAKSWHKDFNAYSIKKHEAAQIYQELALKSYTEDQGVAAHLGFIYLFTKRDKSWVIAEVYQQEPDSDLIIKDVSGLKPFIFHG